MSGSISEHRAILEALRQHDPAQAAAAMAAHIRNTAACAGVAVA
jgi:GntR family transcriptional repressor for pyruvate dehydrogenase complex